MNTLQLMHRALDLMAAAYQMKTRALRADDIADDMYCIDGHPSKDYFHWKRRAYFRRIGAARLEKQSRNLITQLYEQTQPTEKERA